MGDRTRGASRGGAARSRPSFLEAAILSAAVLAVGAAAVRPVGAPAATAPTTTVRVAPSDTLWSIAKAHPLPGASTARTVAAIRAVNGMRGSDLVVGQVIEVPEPGEASLAAR
ncbi:MAG: LysM peptidoglycan-binding domain-containing protein [Coriobacteriia bacterium]|nr:LysM peptidoglycan-binding domain-containing protein [Coriobacteriia bacterium]